jgi:hypothetical protein
MEDNYISKRKPSYPINAQLRKYLNRHEREFEVSITYDDLLRFSGGIEIYDKDDNDTLWLSVFYNEFERNEIDASLKRIYSKLHYDGKDNISKHLVIDSIDFCTFGNSKPFRIKIRNILNQNYTYFYVKQADASRIYGLELEELLSPNNINFIVHKDTLIEEHIIGIPGDIYIKERLDKAPEISRSQIAKEFVKFNERCFIRLLGDMRSYNYVFVLSHDFDRIQYRLRAIDFDQQSFEGAVNIYKPQFFKENFKLVELASEILSKESIEQYIIEERSAIARRAISEYDRLYALIDCMKSDSISLEKHITNLKTDLFQLTHDVNFKHALNMGDILKASIDFVIRNYKS